MPRHWLMLRFSALGDVALTTGVLAYWQRRFGLHFSVLTKEAFAPLFDGHPAVGEVFGLDADSLRPAELFPWFRRLARQHPDWGLLDLHGTSRTRLLSLFWQGPVRRYPKYSVARRAFLVSRGRLGQETLLAASVPQRYALALEKRLPPEEAFTPQLYLAPQERAAGAEWLAALGLERGAPLVALHPYATYARKAWPREHWQALAGLLDEARLPWLVVGRGEALFPGHDRDLTNRTSLRESAAVLAAATLLVTGDSGPMHLASAVGTPVLALFGPTTKEWGFFPSGPRDVVLERDLPCRPCSLHGNSMCSRNGECLRAIPPEEVLARVLEMAAAASPAP